MSSVTAIDAFFIDLDPLLKRPMLAVELEEQPHIDDLSPSDVPLLATLFEAVLRDQS